MKIPVGGYQMVDFGGIEIGTTNLTVTNAKVANIIRNSRKPIIISGIRFTETSSDFIVYPLFERHTGAFDGKIIAYELFFVTTDDDKITFTLAD